MSTIIKAENWLKTPIRVLDRILDGTGFVGILIMFALSVFILMVILSRHIAGFNVPGFFDATTYSLIVFPFLTAALALRAGKHVVVDVIINHLSEKAQAVMRIITLLTSLFFTFAFVWHSTIWCLHLFRNDVVTPAVWQIPQWILVAVIDFGGILLIIQIFRNVASDFQNLVSGKATGDISVLGIVTIAGFIVGFAGSYYLFVSGQAIPGLIILLIVVLLSGMPVFLGLGILATLALFSSVGFQGLIQVPTQIYSAMDSFPLTCLPLFVFAGMVMEKGKIVDDLFKFVEAWLGHFTPSLLIVTILTGMIICSLTGSTTAATAMLAGTALPILFKRGYNKSLCCGIIAVSASGGLIPPSLGYVVYGMLVNESIGKLFIATILPAIMLFALFIIYILLLNVVNKKALFEGGQIPQLDFEKVTWKQKFVLTWNALPILFTPVLVIGSIYTGIFTPTESAAALLLYSLFIVVFIKKSLGWRDVYKTCASGALVSSLILCILATGMFFAGVVSQMGVSKAIFSFTETLQLNSLGVIALIFIVLLIMGMFMSGLAFKPITLPIFYPMAMAVGIDPVWLGVFYMFNGEMATFTPPFGTDFFVLKALLNIPFMTVARGILPFVILFIIGIAILVIFPDLALWLPSTMAGK